MRPTVAVYTRNESLKKELISFLPHDVNTVKLDSTSTPNYVIAIVETSKELNIVMSKVASAKAVIALPISLKNKVTLQDNLSVVYYYELLTSKLSATSGYANWVLSTLKQNKNIFLPEKDISTYFVTSTELAKYMTRVAFGFFKSGEIFVFHNSTIHKLADWVSSIKSEYTNSVDRELVLQEVKLDLEMEKKVLPLSGEVFLELFENSEIATSKAGTPKKFKKFRSRPSLRINYKIIRPFVLLLFLALMPVVLFFVSFISIRLAMNNLDNKNFAKVNFDIAQSASSTNLSLIGVLPDNEFENNLRNNLDIIDLGRNILALNEQETAIAYETIYKKLSFLDINNPGENLFPSISRHDLLIYSRILPISAKLLGEKKGIYYMVLFADQGLVNSAMTFSLFEGKLLDSSVYSDNYIDDRMLGNVEPPEAIKKNLGEDTFKFRYILFDENTSRAMEKASWFNEKAFSLPIDVVAVIDTKDLTTLGLNTSTDIVEKLKQGSVDQDKALISSLFSLLKTSHLKVWSGESALNSVFTELDFTGDNAHLKCLEKNCETLYFYPFNFIFDRDASLTRKGELAIKIEADVFKFKYNYFVKNNSDKEIYFYEKIFTDNLEKPEVYQKLKAGESREIVFEWQKENTLDFKNPYRLNLQVPKQDFGRDLELHLTVNGRTLYNTTLSEDLMLNINY